MCALFLCNSCTDTRRGFIIALEIALILLYCYNSQNQLQTSIFFYFYALFLCLFFVSLVHYRSGKIHERKKKRNRELIVPSKLIQCSKNCQFIKIVYDFFSSSNSIYVAFDIRLLSARSSYAQRRYQWISIHVFALLCAVPDALMNCFVATLFNQPITHERTLLVQWTKIRFKTLKSTHAHNRFVIKKQTYQ